MFQNNRKRSFKLKTTLSNSNIDSEHSLQKTCVKRLRGNGFLVCCNDIFNSLAFVKDVKSKAILKNHLIAMGSVVGFPDLTIFTKDKPVFVEFKYAKGKKSPEQILQTQILESMGYEVLEWRTENECIDWIVQYYNNKAKQ